MRVLSSPGPERGPRGAHIGCSRCQAGEAAPTGSPRSPRPWHVLRSRSRKPDAVAAGGGGESGETELQNLGNVFTNKPACFRNPGAAGALMSAVNTCPRAPALWLWECWILKPQCLLPKERERLWGRGLSKGNKQLI